MKQIVFINYEAPQVESIEVEVEKGFSVTGGNDGDGGGTTGGFGG